MKKNKFLGKVEELKEERKMTESISKLEHSNFKGHGHKMSCKGTPTSIKGLLELLIDEEVIIILESGEEEKVEIVAVMGNLLAASLECGKHEHDKHKFERIKFIDIDCICAVIAECEEVLEGILGIRCGKCRGCEDDD